MKKYNKLVPKENRIILDLCGGTGAFSQPYKDDGYDVRNITLPHYDLFDVELDELAGAIHFLNLDTGEVESVEASKVYGILAAPTCTMFSLARTTAKTPRDLQGGMKLVQKCLNIIHFCRLQSDSVLTFWALENPRGLLRQFLGIPHLTFNPCDYGDDYTKSTDLWGYFNLPKTSPRVLTDEEKRVCSFDSRPLPKLPDGYIMPKDWSTTAARRSITSAFFAKAFFKANK